MEPAMSLSEKSLSGKNALVTGASGGVGGYIAMELARAGCNVAINYRDNSVRAEELANSILKLGVRALCVKADVTDSEQVLSMIESTEHSLGRVDILINNAGISIDGMSWKLANSSFEKTIETNLFGPFYCTKAVLPGMRERLWGRVINISSVVGQIGVVGASAYAASKAGLIGLTKSTAKEVAKKYITVNVLTLGYIKTGMFLALNNGLREEVEKNIPFGSAGDPEDVAKIVVFLCSDAAKYITGATIDVNGGLH